MEDKPKMEAQDRVAWIDARALKPSIKEVEAATGCTFSQARTALANSKFRKSSHRYKRVPQVDVTGLRLRNSADLKDTIRTTGLALVIGADAADRTTSHNSESCDQVADDNATEGATGGEETNVRIFPGVRRQHDSPYGTITPAPKLIDITSIKDNATSNSPKEETSAAPASSTTEQTPEPASGTDDSSRGEKQAVPVSWGEFLNRCVDFLFRLVVGALLVAAGGVIAYYALDMNYQYAMSIDGSHATAEMFRAAEVVALALPTVWLVYQLKNNTNAVRTAKIVWRLLIALALMSTFGFAAKNVAKIKAEGDHSSSTYAALQAEIRDLEQRRDAIVFTDTPDALRAAVTEALAKVPASVANKTKTEKGGPCTDVTQTQSAEACKPVLQASQRLARAIEREKVIEALNAANARLTTAQVAPENDPFPTMAAAWVNWLLGGVQVLTRGLIALAVAPIDMFNLRLALQAILPHLAGVIMSLGFGLVAGRK